MTYHYKKKVLLKGPLLSRSGYGEQARFALRSLESRSDLFDIYAVNIPWGSTGQIIDRGLRCHIDDLILKTAQYAQSKGPFDISIQVTIPLEFEKIASLDIGYTAAVETTRISGAWIEKCNNLVDKIIAVSNHAKDVLVNTIYTMENSQTGEMVPDWSVKVPVEVAHYPVLQREPEPLDVDFQTTKNFLIVSQWGIRKNIENSIKWFVEEFRNDGDVGLVLKTNMASDAIVDRLMTAHRLKGFLSTLGERDCKVYLVHGEVLPEQLTWLYRHPSMKALINIGHGEGFGLPLFEAAYNGLPLVTIAWSGQMDFICKPNKKGKAYPRVARVDYDIKRVQKEAVWENVVEAESMWAYAKEHSYKKTLREVLTREVHYRKEASALQKHIIANFKEEEMYSQFCKHVWDPSDSERADLDSSALADSTDLLAGINLV